MVADPQSSATVEFERHRFAISRFIRKMILDTAEADDLTQETFIRAFRQRATLRDADALLSWLYQIATHVTLDRIRQRNRLRSRQDEQSPEDVHIEDHRAPSALTLVQQNEMSGCVQQYLVRVSDVYRVVLLLHDVEGLTAPEIAQLLGLPLTTVKMRLHRARRTVRSILQEACAFGQDERGVLVCDPKPHQ